MATEHEIDRMVVRLVGNQEDYQKMLKDVEKQTEKSASWAEEQGRKITDAFNRAFKSAQGMLSTIGSGMQKAGAASMAASAAVTAPLGKAAMDFSEYGKSINDMVRQSEQAAKRAADLQKSLVGNTEAFKELSRVIKLTEEEAAVFKMMSERTGVSLETLTKTVKIGSEEYEKWRKEAEKFGLVLGKDQVKAADALAESWHRVKQALNGMWTQIGSIVSDEWKEWNDLIVGTIQWTTKWIKENKELIKSIADIAVKLAAVGGALVALGTALSTVATFLGPIVGMIAAGAAAWLAWDTATGKFLTGSGKELWNQYGEAVISAYNTVVSYGKQIVDHVSKVMDGVFDAIKAGNLELAIEILWSGVKVAWIAAMEELSKITNDRFGAIFHNLAAGNWKDALEAAINEVLILWNKMLLAVEPIFNKVVEVASGAWVQIVNGLDAAWVQIQNIFGMIRALIKDVADSIMSKWAFVKTFFEGLGSFIGYVWENTFGRNLRIIGTFAKGVFAVMGQVKDVVLGVVSGLGGALGSSLMMMVKAAMSVVEKATGAAVDLGKFQAEMAGAMALGPGGQAGIKAAGMMLGALQGSQEVVDTTSAQDVEASARQGRDIRLKQRQEARLAEEARAAQVRATEAAEREMEILGKIGELERKNAELKAKGQADAEAALNTEKKALQVQLDQAKAEREAAEAQAANAADTAKFAEEQRRLQERALRLEQQRAGIVERFDPVAKYMRQLRELNALFDESERSSKVYKEALTDIMEELEDASMKVEVRFDILGMDAVKKGTQEYQQLVANSVEAFERQKALAQSKAEAERRQGEIDAAGLTQEEQAQISATGQITDNLAIDSTVDSSEEARAAYEEALAAINNAKDPFARSEAEQQLKILEQENPWIAEVAANERSVNALDPFSRIQAEQEAARARELIDQQERNLTTEDLANISATGTVQEAGITVEDKQVPFLDRIAQAVEKLVDQPRLVLEPLGAM